jgi:hypothetical protein
MISPKTLILAAAAFAGLSSVMALVPAPPANDNFASAASLGIGSSSAVDNTYATAQPGEPVHFTYGGSLRPSHSLWWKFVPTFNGYVQFDTVGSNYDTVLSVYTGTVLTSLTRVAQNNDPDVQPPVTTSILRIPVTKGVTYHIAVDGLTSGAVGSTILNITTIRINTPRTYQTVLKESYVKDDDGLLSFTTTATSLVTGKVVAGGRTFAFTGAVSVDGRLVASIDRSGEQPVVMDLTVGTETSGTVYGPATGTVQMGDTTINVTAYPAGLYTTAAPCPRAGHYDYAVTATGAVGYGVASVTVGTTGTCTGSGTLGDGTPFVFSAPLLDDSGGEDGDIGTGGTYCYHVPLYSLQGQMTGIATFDASTTPVSVGGMILWFRPAPKTGVAFLPQGIFGSEVTTFGNLYLPPAATHRVDDAFPASGACTLSISDVDFPALTKSLVLSNANAFAAPVPNPNLITLKVATPTGFLSGTVKLINSATSYKVATVNGVIINYPGTPLGFYGYATGISGNSALYITP